MRTRSAAWVAGSGWRLRRAVCSYSLVIPTIPKAKPERGGFLAHAKSNLGQLKTSCAYRIETRQVGKQVKAAYLEPGNREVAVQRSRPRLP
jgi:hypothetical protein